MDKEWIPVVGTLLGVLAGSFIGYFFKNLEIKNQIKEEKRIFIRTKIEEAHKLITQYIINVGNFTIEIHELNGKDSRREGFYQAQKLIVESSPQIMSTIKLYLPTITEDWIAFNKQTNIVQALGRELLQEHNSTDSIRKVIEEHFDQEFDTAKRLCFTMLKKIEELMALSLE